MWRCDRCGETYDWYKSPSGENGDGNTVKRVVTGEHWEKYAMYGDDFELCPSCMAALNDWLRGNVDAKVLLCRGAGGEDVHCYTIENAANDRVAESSAVRLCKAHYPKYEEIKPVRMEYVGK